MRVEWLNGAMTEAIVTKGWFRKRQAHVARALDCDAWFYVANGTLVEGAFCGEWGGHNGLCARLDYEKRCALKERAEQAKRADGLALAGVRAEQPAWQPVGTLPAARLVERKT